jgi:hypothetical protein
MISLQRPKSAASISVAGAVRHFTALAETIELHVNGLVGLTIYRDSQFESEWRRASFDDVTKLAARAAFNYAIDERVVRRFPDHPLTKFSRERLARANQAAA